MAARFTANGDGFLDCGSGSSMDDLTAFTMWAILSPVDSNIGTRPRIMSHGDDTRDWRFFSTSRMEFHVLRATGTASWIANIGSNCNLVEGQFYFVAAVYDAADATVSGLFVGDLNSDIVECDIYDTDVIGSGATTADAGTNLYISNRSSGAANRAGDVDYSEAGYISAALTLDELNRFRHHRIHSSAVGHWKMFKDSGTIPDLTGNGNDGTYSGTHSKVGHAPILLPTAQILKFPPAAVAGQTISGTVGEIATGYVGPSQTIANVTPQAITGTVGEISTGEAFAIDHVLALSARQTISGTVGEISTGEAFETDHNINIPGQEISGTVGEIATGFVGPSQTIALSTPQAISGTVGEIVTGFVSPSPTITKATHQAISGTVGEIPSGESFATNHVIALASAGGAKPRRPLGVGMGVGFH